MACSMNASFETDCLRALRRAAGELLVLAQSEAQTPPDKEEVRQIGLLQQFIQDTDQQIRFLQ